MNFPSSVNGWQSRFDEALSLRDRGEPDACIAILQDLAREYPNVAAIFGMLGGTQWQVGRLENAAANFRRATQLSPKSELSSLGLFHALWDLGHRQEALSEMRRFLALGESKEYSQIQLELGLNPEKND